MLLTRAEMPSLTLSLIVHPHSLYVISLILCEALTDPFFGCPPAQPVRDIVNPVRDALADPFFDCPSTQKVRELVNLVWDVLINFSFNLPLTARA